jgi:hypothetical protein
MIDPVGGMPFAIDANVKAARQSIENHQEQQNIEREHQRVYRQQKVVEQQQVALQYSYDRLGDKKAVEQPQGSQVDIEV